MSQPIERPWPVYVLVVLSVASMTWALVVDPQRNFWDFFAILINALFAWALWTGKPWAFSISFMLASLCVVLTLGVALVQVFLMELLVSTSLLWAAAGGTVWIVLLMFPVTKRFAGMDQVKAEA